jgi:hypothetical protein
MVSGQEKGAENSGSITKPFATARNHFFPSRMGCPAGRHLLRLSRWQVAPLPVGAACLASDLPAGATAYV